jgi:hypothetical protein
MLNSTSSLRESEPGPSNDRLESFMRSLNSASSSKPSPDPPDPRGYLPDNDQTDVTTTTPLDEYQRAYGDHSLDSLPEQSAGVVRLGAYLRVSSMLGLRHSPTYFDPEKAGLVEKLEMRRMMDE